jgi:hypothetical protein
LGGIHKPAAAGNDGGLRVAARHRLAQRRARRGQSSAAFFSLWLLVAAGPAHAADTLNDAIVGGKFDLSLRYRFEYVDQDGFARKARASTMRSYVGYGTDAWRGFSANLALQGVFAIGNEQYNSTVNGKTKYPVVADPEVLDLDQAYLQYASPWATTARVGRQRIIYDNHRFVGNVGFRQNEQTFDAVRAINTSLNGVTAEYAFIDNVNRIFGPHAPPGPNDGVLPMSSHLFHVEYKEFKPLTLVGYGYLLDFTRPANFGLSTATFGLRLIGEYPVSEMWKAFYMGEYARQSDYAQNPASYGLNYYLLEGGPGYGPVSAKVGYEVLEGNGAVAVQTPLATLHAFQGWADQFLTTPANGVRDLYYLASATVEGVKMTAVYHDFDAERGGANLGREWDAVASRNFLDHYTVELKFADYLADTFKTDTKKYWVSLIVNF